MACPRGTAFCVTKSIPEGCVSLSTAYLPTCELKTDFELLAEKVKSLCNDPDPAISTLAQAQWQFIEAHLVLADASER